MPQSSKMRTDSFAEYPLGLETTPLLGEDRVSYHRRLMEDSSRLFKNETDIEVLLSHQKDDATLSSPLAGLWTLARLTSQSNPVRSVEGDLVHLWLHRGEHIDRTCA